EDLVPALGDGEHEDVRRPRLPRGGRRRRAPRRTRRARPAVDRSHSTRDHTGDTGAHGCPPQTGARDILSVTESWLPLDLWPTPGTSAPGRFRIRVNPAFCADRAPAVSGAQTRLLVRRPSECVGCSAGSVLRRPKAELIGSRE